MTEQKKEFWRNEINRVKEDMLNDLKKFNAVVTAQLKYLKELERELEE